MLLELEEALAQQFSGRNVSKAFKLDLYVDYFNTALAYYDSSSEGREQRTERLAKLAQQNGKEADTNGN